MTDQKNPKMITPWKQCKCCEDFICSIHKIHVAECSCPAIDDWCAADLYPYLRCDQEAVMRFLNESENRKSRS